MKLKLVGTLNRPGSIKREDDRLADKLRLRSSPKSLQAGLPGFGLSPIYAALKMPT